MMRGVAGLTLLAFSLVSSIALADGAPLTKAQVKRYIQTEIAIGKLQKNMKAHASEYKDLIHTFFARRKKLLNARGWTVKEFKAVQDRITAAQNGLKTAKDLAQSKVQFEASIHQMNSNPYMSKEQKEQYIHAQRQMRAARRRAYIEPTRQDWPAVKAYRDELKQLTAWYAGNVAAPPAVDERQ